MKQICNYNALSYLVIVIYNDTVAMIIDTSNQKHYNLFHFYSGSKNEMMRLEQLFLEDQFHPLEAPQQPLSILLAMPLQKEKDAKKRAQKRKQSNT